MPRPNFKPSITKREINRRNEQRRQAREARQAPRPGSSNLKDLKNQVQNAKKALRAAKREAFKNSVKNSFVAVFVTELFRSAAAGFGHPAQTLRELKASFQNRPDDHRIGIQVKNARRALKDARANSWERVSENRLDQDIFSITIDVVYSGKEGEIRRERIAAYREAAREFKEERRSILGNPGEESPLKKHLRAVRLDALKQAMVSLSGEIETETARQLKEIRREQANEQEKARNLYLAAASAMAREGRELIVSTFVEGKKSIGRAGGLVVKDAFGVVKGVFGVAVNQGPLGSVRKVFANVPAAYKKAASRPMKAQKSGFAPKPAFR